MTVRRISYLDTQTGEIMMEGQLVWQHRRKKSPFGREWFAMAQTTALDIARVSRELGIEAVSVMHYLLAKLDYENYVHVVQRDISEQLNMRQPNISRAIRRLVEIEILLAGPRSGRAKTYRFNPHFVWRGSTNTHDVEHRKTKRLRIVRRSERRATLEHERPRDVIDMFTGKTDAELQADEA